MLLQEGHEQTLNFDDFMKHFLSAGGQAYEGSQVAIEMTFVRVFKFLGKSG